MSICKLINKLTRHVSLVLKMEVFKTEKDTLEKVLKILGKTKEVFDEDVANIRTWMKNQPHLPEVLETKAIENFLILNKCDIEQTKQRIDMYYTTKSRLKDIFDEINPKLPYMKQLKNAVHLVVHPQMTKQMYRVCFFKMYNKNLAESWQISDISRYLCNIQEVRIREDVTFGDVYVIDGDGITFYQQMKLTPALIHKTVNLIYKQVYNLRVKAVFILNFPPYCERILGLTKIFVPKVVDRIHICENISVLKDHLPVEIIPKDYGGEGASLSELQALLDAKFDQYQDLFDRLDTLRVDENFRPEKMNDDVFGHYGNFKKLDID